MGYNRRKRKTRKRKSKKNRKKSLELFFFFSNNIVGGDIITFKYRYRKQIIIGISIFILLSTLLTILVINLSRKSNKKQSEKQILLTRKTPKKETKEKEEAFYVVDIKGEINNPGIYKLSKDSRVTDVIEMAGGLTEKANTSVINLSKKINDEMVIIIYSNYEVENFKRTKELEETVINKCNQKDSDSLKNDACIETDTKEATDTNSKISLNNATKEELMSLTGIGESKADDIISYRNSNGGFKNIEDIKNIKGIGESIFAKIKDRLTL